MATVDKAPMLAEGHRKLVDEVRQLKMVERPAIIQAIEEAGLKPGKDIVIVSIDGVRGAFEAMMQGKLNATVECNPLLGPTLMQTAQAVVAGLVALWVLVLGGRLAWLATFAVGLVSLVALVASVYVEIPAIGPFPTLYEPLWYSDKVLAAVSAAVATVVAAVALPRLRSRY